jgi:hypothetical protein
MWQVLLQLIPLAGAAAISMVPIAATVFILLSERRRVAAPPFVIGWVVGTASALTLATLISHALPGRARQRDALIVDLEIGVGCALIALGIVTLVRQRRAPTSRLPGWIEGLGSFGTLPTFGIGLALNIRPKALLLTTAAGLAITRGHLSLEEDAVLIAIYTLVATSTVAGPVLATLLLPERMEPRVVATRDFITAHGAAVTASIMILIGVLVVGTAFGA